jgi:hypothetical protein
MTPGNVDTTLAVADRGYVLSAGQIQLAASGAEMIRRLPEIEAMYLSEAIQEPPQDVQRSQQHERREHHRLATEENGHD